MPQIELLTLANHAEAINGLLYLSGAGWTDLWRQLGPGQVPVNHIGIGVAILVGWNETNQRHRVVLRIENADGKVLVNVEGDIEMGRPAGLAPGSDLRGVMAINGEVQFPAAGLYRIVATVGSDKRSVTLRVHDAPMPTITQPPQVPPITPGRPD
jgi:hypothetical protein